MKNKTFPTQIMLFLAACTFLLSACTEDTIEQETEVSVNPEAIEELEEDSQLITKYFLGDAVQVRLEEDGTYSLAGTDTRLFEDQLADSPDAYNPNPVPGEELTALALAGGIRKWTNNTVYYVINGLSASVRSELEKSFAEWSNKTNVTFKERTNQSNYVTISSSGSNSNSGVATLGMYNSRGYIQLGTRATAVVIIHELGHTLGYIHEQNRSDRDNHIIIRTENIQSNAQDQFYKSSSATLLTGSFDVNSIMMYGSYTFSKNGRPTITDLNGNTLPQRQARLSTLDIQGTNAAYPSSGGGNPDPEPEDLCDSTANYSSSKRYNVGDYVLYYGRLYQRDFTRWNYIKNCN
ncbi:M12 family metallopeptidase [Zobellia uliginosa]|uniref:M12 family metallopeptidase n=1 Tax=Zobellia uliginosa TaxID=143224 RepID=UPI001C066FAA|nr:M12 family metallopeptidase [Zobellia uliginosa]MBU2947218.1 peptidase M12 [Zobellia uliginosa]